VCVFVVAVLLLRGQKKEGGGCGDDDDDDDDVDEWDGRVICAGVLYGSLLKMEGYLLPFRYERPPPFCHIPHSTKHVEV